MISNKLRAEKRLNQLRYAYPPDYIGKSYEFETDNINIGIDVGDDSVYNILKPKPISKTKSAVDCKELFNNLFNKI